jgi:hypothetical protein
MSAVTGARMAKKNRIRSKIVILSVRHFHYRDFTLKVQSALMGRLAAQVKK